MSDNPFRLPRHVAPTHYDIRLDLDLETFTFQGGVGIDLDVVEPTDSLTLNTAEIEIKSATLSKGAQISEIAYDDEMERATLSLDSTLEPGSSSGAARGTPRVTGRCFRPVRPRSQSASV